MTLARDSSWYFKRIRFKLGWVAFLLIANFAGSFCAARNNSPPRFLIDGQTEIVVRLKEGPETPVGEYRTTLQSIDCFRNHIVILK